MLTHNKQEVRVMPSVVTQQDRDRFWTKVAITANPNLCWEWQRFTNRGYGVFRLQNGVYFAHRVAYFLYYGQDPLDKCCIHSCDNRSCTNPAHLTLGTNYENFMDSVSKGRNKLALGEDNYTAKLTKDQVLSIIDECSKSDITYEELGEKYGVGSVTILNIIQGKTWKHLPTPIRFKKNHPLPSGEKHWTKTNPEKIASGAKSGARLHPESTPRGVANGMSKLTDDQVRSIIKEYSTGMSQAKLSKKYSVSQSLVSLIVTGNGWKHIHKNL